MHIRFLKKKKGLHTLEYAIIILIIVAALIAIQVYFKRGVQGGLRDSTDKIGNQYSAANFTSDYQTDTNTQQKELRDKSGQITTDIIVNDQTKQGYETVAGLNTEDTPVSTGAPVGAGTVTTTGTGTSTSTGDDTGTGVITGTDTGKGKGSGTSGSGLGTSGSGSGSGGAGSGTGSGNTGTGSGNTGTGSGNTGTGAGNTGSDGAQDISYNSTIAAAIAALCGSTSGASECSLIQDKHISVLFGDFSQIYGDGADNIMASWEGVTYNTIFVNKILETQSPPEAIAGIIAHEATHADYDYYPQKWIDSTLAEHPGLSASDLHIPGNSIDQECNAFGAATEVWNEIKGSLHDTVLDGTAAAYAQGEANMKSAIRSTYQDQSLPEF